VVLTPEEVRARREAEAAPDEQPADALESFVSSEVVAAPEPESEEEVASAADGDTQADDGVEPPNAEEPGVAGEEAVMPADIEPQEPEEPADDDTGRFEELSGLFARLREPPERVEPEISDQATEQPADESTPPPERRVPRYGGDPFELRSRLILPVSNRALRNLKRQLTEAQNEALEELRLSDGEWDPDGPSLGARLRPDLVVLASEAFAAGHSAAMEMTGERFKRPSTPKTEPETEWIAALLQDVNHALVEGRRQGQGARQLGASVSRVFRSWRTDEAERRVAELAAGRYHAGLAEVLQTNGHTTEWVVSGRGCASCRTSAESEPGEWETLPPAHPNCGCTLIPA
jgi:hypothetical protein